MQFQALGPMRVTADAGEEIRIARPKLRLLLAVLLARAGAVVPATQLTESLWGHRPPESARANLKTYVWSLRRLLAPGDPKTAPIRTDTHGYAVAAPPAEVDLATFERLVADGVRARRQGALPLAAERLEQGLTLWRGSAFQDVPLVAEVLANAAQRLEELRLTATEELFDARIGTGRHAEVVAPLRELTARHPLRERLWEQLMLALYRDGRQADALGAYQRLRGHLVEEIGVEPGPAVRALQRRILTADQALLHPPATAAAARAAWVAPVAAAAGTGRLPVPPRQLPLDVATFVARRDELTRLCALLEPGGPERPGPVVVIHGAAGAGKSALAVRAANLSAARFPDGQLYLNLRGATPGVPPLTAEEGLGRLVRSLGVPAADLPPHADDLGALFRTLVAGRRVLLVLDDAAGSGQLRPLLPGGLGTAVLVTSRTTLGEVEGSTHLGLGPLDPAAARDMLGRLLADERVAADPPAADELARLCGHLPLSLHIAAARLTARPGWRLRDLVWRLADERRRLTELATGDLAVRGSLAVSYRALRDSGDADDQRAAHALLLLGPLRVLGFAPHLVAALLAVPAADADRAVERLVAAHLFEPAGPGRHRLHDLVRLFAAERAAADLPAGEADAAAARAVGHYLATAASAARLCFPQRAHYPVPETPCAPRPFAGAEQARQWLEEERGDLVRLARQALTGPPQLARMGVGLVTAAFWFFLTSGYRRDVIGLRHLLVPAAERSGDRRCLASLHGALGALLSDAGWLDEARRHLEAELSLCRELADRFGEQRALGNLGAALLVGGRPGEAVPRLRRQLAIAEEIGAETGQAYARRLLGRAEHRLGRFDRAADLLGAALAWYRSRGDDLPTAEVLRELALVDLDRGRPQAAMRALTASLELTRRAGYREGEGWALVHLARAWRLADDPRQALRCAEQALAAVAGQGACRVRTAARRQHAEALAAAASASSTMEV